MQLEYQVLLVGVQAAPKNRLGKIHRETVVQTWSLLTAQQG